MKVMMPKEMKVRLIANVLATLMGFCNAGVAAWLLIEMVQVGMDMPVPVACILLAAAAGLTFAIAKVAWALKKKTKQLGQFVLGLVIGLDVAGAIMFLVAVPPQAATVTSAVVTILVVVVSLLGGLLMVAGRLVGEMIEKLRYLFHAGIAVIAALVVLLLVIGLLPLTSIENLYAASLAVIVTIGVSVVAGLLGYNAESALIKKKFLVYN